MTGGQMAPTTLMGQKTTTSPLGRTVKAEGFPLRVSELLATLEGPTYIERVALYDNKSRMKARKAVHKALQNQIEGRGFSLIEVLSPCPTGWGLTPDESCDWVRDNLMKAFPLGVLKDESATRDGWTRYRNDVSSDRIPPILGIGKANDLTVKPTPPVPATCYRNPRIKIAGFGGQGLLFLGRLLAEAGMRQGYHVSWLPSYGPEMRGGTANCHVNISTEPIGSPLVSDPTVLIAMNGPSLEKFQNELVSGGVLIYDSSLIDKIPERSDVEIVALPATDLADQIGNAKIANMVALGAYLGTTGLLDQEELFKALATVTKKTSMLEQNLQAIRAGVQFANDSRTAEIQVRV
jgi:2-oxoisovalerate ferredoxin oxidoreductase beta subunit